MRATLALVALLLGCAQQSPLHAPCASERECPAGYACNATLQTCEVPCTTSSDCDGLGGNGAAECTPVGLCTIRCFVATDCPAPLSCARGGGDCMR